MTKRRIIEGLLDNEDLRVLYYTNAWFKAQLDQYAQHLLPTLVAGLAAQAREQNERYEQELQALQQAVPDRVFDPYGRPGSDL